MIVIITAGRWDSVYKEYPVVWYENHVRLERYCCFAKTIYEALDMARNSVRCAHELGHVATFVNNSRMSLRRELETVNGY